MGDVLAFGILHPTSAAALARRLFRAPRVTTQGIALADEERRAEVPSASLMSTAVPPDGRGRCVGARLVDAFLRDMLARGVSSVRLGVHESTEEARRLYHRTGWSSLFSSQLPDGKRTWLYVWNKTR